MGLIIAGISCTETEYNGINYGFVGDDADDVTHCLTVWVRRHPAVFLARFVVVRAVFAQAGVIE